MHISEPRPSLTEEGHLLRAAAHAALHTRKRVDVVRLHITQTLFAKFIYFCVYKLILRSPWSSQLPRLDELKSLSDGFLLGIIRPLRRVAGRQPKEAVLSFFIGK